MNKKNIAVGAQNKVISIPFNATYFFERAVQSLDRFHFEKALKNFKRAVDCEPDNPINYCNMAGILSEIGKYGESNQILSKVLSDIDPKMTECHYYMANNYANMEYFEEAEKELLIYLQEDEDGYYLEEAEEMMELLQQELEHPTPIRKVKVKAKAGIYEHNHARELLENGQFNEAIQLLEMIVEEHPDFLAAQNNLALAYYYIGHTEDAKAAIMKVLEYEPANIHALCNLAIFYQHEGLTKKLEPLKNVLLKLAPFYQEHLFKLATTMGILKEHEAAYRHFMRLNRLGAGNEDASLIHFAAIAAFNLGRYKEAKRLWQLCNKGPSQSELPHYYLELLTLLKDGITLILPYNYHMTVTEQIELWNESVKIPSICYHAYFNWAIEFGDKTEHVKALKYVPRMNGQTARKCIQKLLAKEGVHDYVKRLAIFVLRSLGVTKPIEVVLDGKLQQIELNMVQSDLPIWESKWECVVQLALSRMVKHYDIIEQHDMMILWVDFLSKSYPHIPRLSKLEGWAAALEYLTAKMHQKAVSYDEIATKYDVSVSTLSKRVKQIDEVCGIQQKMNLMSANWLQ